MKYTSALDMREKMHYDAAVNDEAEIKRSAHLQRAGEAGIPAESGAANGPPRER